MDARFSLGEYLMFGALIFVIVSLLVPSSSEQMIYVLGGFWVMFLAVFVDVFILSRKLQKRLDAKVRRGGARHRLVRLHALPAVPPPAPSQAPRQARRIPLLISAINKEPPAV